MPVKNYDGENCREADPCGAPGKCFLEADGMRAPVEDAEVERQHHYDEQVEEDPE